MPAGVGALEKGMASALRFSKSSFNNKPHTQLRSKMPLKHIQWSQVLFTVFTGPSPFVIVWRYLASAFIISPHWANRNFFPLGVTMFPKGNFTQALKLTYPRGHWAPVLALWLSAVFI